MRGSDHGSDVVSAFEFSSTGGEVWITPRSDHIERESQPECRI